MRNTLVNKLIKTPVSKLLVAVSLLCSFTALAETQLLDKVLVVVDSDIITQSAVSDRIRQIKTNFKDKADQLPPDDELYQQILDRMIVESIQLQMGARAGVRISDAVLTETMENIAGNNGMNLPAFKKALEKDGLSYSEMREQIRQEMTISRVQQGNLNHLIQVTDQEVDNFLNSTEGKELTGGQYHLLHVLFPLSSSASVSEEASSKKKAQQLSNQLNRNTLSFKTLANQPRFDGSDVQVSNLGWRKNEDIPSIFAGVAPTLEVGQVSEPIRSPSGFHLIKLEDKRGGTGQIVQQTHARHILIKPSKIRTEKQAADLARQLSERARLGEDFSELAKSYSEDPGSALQGGDLGWANPGQFVPVFEQTMGQLSEGETGDPFQSQFGWHVLQVLERREQDVSLLRWQNMARNTIHQRKFNEELQTWLIKIRDESFVEYK